MRNLVAYVVFYVVSRAPQLAGLLVGSGLLTVLADLTRSPGGALSPWTGVAITLVALLGVLAVGLACALPLLRTTTGGRRTVRDACWETADKVGDWAEWETAPSPARD